MAGDDGHDHVNDAALVAKISQVLLSQACQRIDFRWGKLHVTAKAYRAVVLALSDSRIDIFEADGAEHTLDPNVGASYIGNPESIIIRPHLNAHTALNQRALVHEATHAVQDDQLNGEWVWRLDDEATSYIAEWLFVIHASPNPDHLISKPDPDDPIEVIAGRNRAGACRQAWRVSRSGRDAALGRCDLPRSDLFGHNGAASLDSRRRRHEAGFPLASMAPHATRIARSSRLRTLPLALRGSTPSSRRNVSGTL
ncbi:MAG TPA: hypothetical protein VNY10_21185 [Roseiarcus sp.]|nr:hypothetical protein [Roseiarcus sp.]